MNGYAERMWARYSEVRPNLPSALPRAGPAGGWRAGLSPPLSSPSRPHARTQQSWTSAAAMESFLYFLQSEGYTETQGIDLNPQQLEVARSFGVRNVQCCEGQEFLRSSAGQFDFISAIDVLEHVPKDQVLEFLDLVHAALRPGGRFLCQVPNLAAFYNPVFYMDFSHETPFTASSLKQVLQLANFAERPRFSDGTPSRTA